MQDQFNLARPAPKGYDAVVGPNEMFSTLGQALSVAKDGWRILITGTTRESGKITTSANDLTISGISRGKAYIDVNQAIFIFDGTNIILENVSLNADGAGQLKFTGIAPTLNSINMTVGENTKERPGIYPIYITGLRAKISNFDYKQQTAGSWSGASSYAIIRCEGAYPTITNCVFNSVANGFNSGGLLYLGSALYGTVTNCSFYTSYASSTIAINCGSNNVISNCIFQAGGSGATLAISGGSANVEVSNCIIKNTVRGVSLGTHCTFTGNYISTINSGYCVYDIGAYSTITGNVFTTVSGGTSAYAIRLSADITGTVIANNSFYNIGYAISGDNRNYYTFRNNAFDTVVAPINSPGKIIDVGNNYGSSDISNKTIKLFTNTSGGSLSEGQAVILKSVAGSDEITTTTTGGDNKVWGVVVSATIANNASGYIVTYGKTACKVDGTADIAIGDFLSTFTTAGILKKATAGETAIAIAMGAYTADDSNGTINARIISPRII